MCARLLWNGVGQHVEYGCVLKGYVGLVWSCRVVCGVLSESMLENDCEDIHGISYVERSFEPYQGARTLSNGI